MVKLYEIYNASGELITVTAGLKAAEEYVNGSTTSHKELSMEFAVGKKMAKEFPGHDGYTIKAVSQ